MYMILRLHVSLIVSYTILFINTAVMNKNILIKKNKNQIYFPCVKMFVLRKCLIKTIHSFSHWNKCFFEVKCEMFLDLYLGPSVVPASAPRLV